MVDTVEVSRPLTFGEADSRVYWACLICYDVGKLALNIESFFAALSSSLLCRLMFELTF